MVEKNMNSDAIWLENWFKDMPCDVVKQNDNHYIIKTNLKTAVSNKFFHNEFHANCVGQDSHLDVVFENNSTVLSFNSYNLLNSYDQALVDMLEKMSV